MSEESRGGARRSRQLATELRQSQCLLDRHAELRGYEQGVYELLQGPKAGLYLLVSQECNGT